MHKGNNVMKSIGVGMAVCSAAAAAAAMMGTGKKSYKKNVNKAVKAVGDFVDNVQYMVR